MKPPEVRVFRHIREIDPDLWDQPLGPDDLQATHRFVSACQDADLEHAEYRHVLVLQNGRVLGTGSLFRIAVALDLLSGKFLRGLASRLRRRWQGFLRLPVLFGGLPVSFGGSCLRVTADGDARAVASVVSQQLALFARESNTPFQCVKELAPDEEALFGPPLAMEGFFAAPSLPFCWLPVPWSSWQEYVHALRAPFRRQLLKSVQRLEASGARIRLMDDYRPESPRLFALYRNVMARAPYQLEQLNEQFLVALKDRLGSAARAVVVERDNKLLAAAIVLESPRELTFLIAGIDYDHHRETHAYLALVAHMVAEAIRTGKRRLALGQTSYYVKRRLGAITSSRRLYIRHGTLLAHRALRISAGLLFPDRTYAALPALKP